VLPDRREDRLSELFVHRDKYEPSPPDDPGFRRGLRASPPGDPSLRRGTPSLAARRRLLRTCPFRPARYP
jgi:hypothetical protein